MFGSSSPFALRASYDSETVLDHELLVLDIDLMTASYTYKVSSREIVMFIGSGRRNMVYFFRGSHFSIPSNGSFIVELCCCNFDVLEDVVRLVSFKQVVGGVVLNDRLHLLCRSGCSLLEDGLLNKLIALVIAGGVEDTFDGGNVRVKAQISKSFIMLCHGCLKDNLRLFWEIMSDILF